MKNVLGMRVGYKGRIGTIVGNDAETGKRWVFVQWDDSPFLESFNFYTLTCIK